MREIFRHIARWTAEAVGSPVSFLLALLIVVTWAASGRWFHYSDTWQLVINTGTTIVTFLMVFLIQYAQNRDSKAIQLKLDELIKAAGGARNRMIDLDGLSDEELQKLEGEYKRLCQEAAQHREKHQSK
jgi:low affinity Fe/Cu permease